MAIRSTAFICAAFLAGMASWTGPARSQILPHPAFADAITPPGFPSIGKWMLTAQGIPSDWLGEIYRGKILREPINVIIVDDAAINRSDAVARLIASARQAGYPIRLGHSVGYQGMIGGQLYSQLPKGWDDAFSNEIFELSNNHGRIFGPHLVGQTYLFTAAFSRERVDPFRWPGHRFASFNQARDDFAERMSRNTAYKVIGSVSLDNALMDNPKLTTGDHDGTAIVLRNGP
ncbi:hypothetical protein MHY87_05185 [Microvirga sp. ACRRW]|uniref:hypothetical protein n=1 Tax=Microvirga sp. ACRRW TaxID=2918205 RepID=UPI001EF530E2|nr:hypothetical protein [Microvirga sp. ACRRW]MCG7392293.1 hypothetical protein [Microvirga sp. ACRRW]